MDDKERGLGHVVYSVEDSDRSDDEGLPDEPQLVDEASEESFPASDPPSYARGTSEHTSDADGEPEGPEPKEPGI